MIKDLLVRWWREITIAILICAVGFLATRKDKIKIETVVEYREKVVTKVEEKIVYRERDKIKTRTIVKTKDGEVRVQEETRTKDRDISTGIRREQEKTVDTSRKESVETQSTPARYLLGVGGGIDGGTYTGSFLVRPFPNIPAYIGPMVILNDRKFSLGVSIGVAL